MLHWRTRLTLLALAVAAAVGSIFDGWSWT
jgi:hypothetical protein